MTKRPAVVSVHFTMERGYCQWAFGGWRSPARMFFVSEGNRDVCSPAIAGIVPESRCKVLNNGLDLDAFVPDVARRSRYRHELGIGDETAVGVACALRPRKQLEHLFKAVAQLPPRRWPKVLVAGAPVQGDEAYAAQLMDRGKQLLGDRLVPLGHIEDLRDFYNSLDVFVNTSQEEACSISVIEAMACGCPVLGYPSKSVDVQIIPNGGEIVSQDDIGKLSAVLHTWLEDSDRLQCRRALARQQAEERFDIRKLAQQLWREYEDVLAETTDSRLLQPAMKTVSAKN